MALHRARFYRRAEAFGSGVGMGDRMDPVIARPKNGPAAEGQSLCKAVTRRE